MFQPRSSDFDPRVSAIVDHLRAIERELGAIGKIAGRRASSRVSAVASHIFDAIGPTLNELNDRFRRGQQSAIDEATNFGTEAIQAGARAGNEAFDRIGDQAKQRPLFTLAVALGIGMLIGLAARWDWNDDPSEVSEGRR
jgi:ElaB/YqjD/DUF883 family membrane-anchored ribosome-binding protein